MSHGLPKTFSFALVHFTVAFTVVYWLTGNWLASSLTALIEPAINTVAYHLHEKVWARRAARAQAVVGSHSLSAFQPPSRLTTAR
jgi:uncharacterized membrane protein